MTHRTPTLLLVALLGLSLTACTADSDGRADTTHNGQEATAIPEPGGRFEIPSRVASISPIQVEVLEKGDGLLSRAGDTVAVHYTGTLLDGTEFDSSRGDVPFEFPLGQGAVIRGWDMIVSKMRVGDRWKVRIPSELAYGEIGSPPVIPPSADLVFVMKLVRVR